ncbi:hypothetical protein [Kribbella qitaiheensis]|uniref:hypothetical protein n=1 Tax=Kribbella qitaiheensis TaxID=1544730 RepID=UPI001628131D|nr:hypothetical protein [Kribbella qitaiheensis]
MRRRFGLRDRVMLAYGLLALGLSTGLALVTFNVVANYLTDQRESSAVVETLDNQVALDYGLFGTTSNCLPIRTRGETECSSIVVRANVNVINLLYSLPARRLGDLDGVFRRPLVLRCRAARRPPRGHGDGGPVRRRRAASPDRGRRPAGARGRRTDGPAG